MNENESNIAYQTEVATMEGDAKYTEQPSWSNDAAIYEVNIRQFSEEGTLNAVTAQLERIKNMGIEIIWLMPVHPISEVKRKGELGSYYAVGDFRAVNPDYGTMEDLERLLAKAHGLGLKVILDWVPNHTGWDHPWITEHPEYYTHKDGKITDPLKPDGESWGWVDVADLNYDNEGTRRAMINDMKFWIEEKGIDGFRVDVAHAVPVDFWEEAIPELRAAAGDTKKIFMLAEAENPQLAGLFNMSYGWRFHHTLPKVLRGEQSNFNIGNDVHYFGKEFGSNHYAMMFTTNHDENSWQGTVFERYGDAHKAMAVLTFTINGMPLMYSGQEAGMNKRLEFFEKDAIEWGDYPLQSFYTKLLHLKKANKALWNGDFGGDITYIQAKNDEPVYVYMREKDGNKVMVAVNFADRKASFNRPPELEGDWKIEMGEVLSNDDKIELDNYGYAVWVKND